MPKFAYSAIDAAGAEIEGTTKADTIGTARSLLVEQNLFPIKIEESRGLFDLELTKEKVKKKNLMNFTRQLSVFVKAGIPITDALITIGDETEDVALRRALGNLVDDPELRFTASGVAMAKVRFAVNRRYQRGGEWQEETSFFGGTCWRDMGENVAESLTKGSRVIVSGELQQRSWETQDGDKRSIVEVDIKESHALFDQTLGAGKTDTALVAEKFTDSTHTT